MTTFECRSKSWKLGTVGEYSNNKERTEYEGSCGSFRAGNNEYKDCGGNQDCGCYQQANNKLSGCPSTWKPESKIYCLDQSGPTDCPDGYVCCGTRLNPPGNSSGGALGICGKSCNSCGPKILKLPESQYKEMGVRIYKGAGCNGDFIELIPSLPRFSESDYGIVPPKGIEFYCGGSLNAGPTDESSISTTSTGRDPETGNTILNWTYPSFVVRTSANKQYIYNEGKMTPNLVPSTYTNSLIKFKDDKQIFKEYFQNMQSIYVPPHLEVDFLMEDPNTGYMTLYTDYPGYSNKDLDSTDWKESIYNPANRINATETMIWVNSPPNKAYLRGEILGTKSPNSLDGDGATGCVCPNGPLYQIQPSRIRSIYVRVRGMPRYHIDTKTGQLATLPGDKLYPWPADDFTEKYMNSVIDDTNFKTGPTGEVQPGLLPMTPYKSENIEVKPNIAWLMFLYASAVNSIRQKKLVSPQMRKNWLVLNEKGENTNGSESITFFTEYARKQMDLRNTPGSSDANPPNSRFFPGSDIHIVCLAGKGNVTNITPQVPDCTVIGCKDYSYRLPDQYNNCADIDWNICANVITQTISGQDQYYFNSEGEIVDGKTGNRISNVVMNNNCVFAAKEEDGYVPCDNPPCAFNEPPPPPDPPSTNGSNGGSGMGWIIWLVFGIILIILFASIIGGIVYFIRKNKKNKV